MSRDKVVLFETNDKKITLSVQIENETVWLNRNQMSDLFERDVKTIGKHINNVGDIQHTQDELPPAPQMEDRQSLSLRKFLGSFL